MVWLLFFCAARCSGGTGYETDERSSLGLETERRRGRKKRGRQWAAVEKPEEKREPDRFFGHRNPARRDNPKVVGSNPSAATKKP